MVSKSGHSTARTAALKGMNMNDKIEEFEMTLCKICGSETRRLYDPQMMDCYHVCPFCDYIFLDEEGYASFEDEKTRYMEHDNSYENEGYRDFLEGFLEAAVFPFGNGFKRALDFGSGPEPVLARIMREKHGIETDIYDLHFSPDREYMDKKYDLIVATEVLEHLKDPVETLSGLKERLEPNGLLSVMTLFHHVDDKAFLGWHYRRDKTHIGFFTAKTLEIAGRAAGLELIHADGKRIATFKKRIECP
ncbi:MAG: class I SAM-dependent methyltransferase [Clostridiales bacterium]|nr:MAG: class I SAM-dependent methyltransferase [Clostridiales bacterium]